MHTVPKGYLRAFADKSPSRGAPNVWQFGREATEGKLISVRDASVRTDIYTLRGEDGRADTRIETELLSVVDSVFPAAVHSLSSGETPEYWDWRNIFRFMAFQLARTPQIFQILRDEGIRQGVGDGTNFPQLAMVHEAPFLEKWLCGMAWTLCWHRSTLPLLTSDSPVVMWADRGDGAEVGVGFEESGLRILFPLTPKMCLTATQTEATLKAVLDEPADSNPHFSDTYPLRIETGRLSIGQAVMLNQVTVSNAHRYVYSNSADDNVRLFLKDQFFGLSGLVRRSDRKPIGSLVDPEEGVG